GNYEEYVSQPGSLPFDNIESESGDEQSDIIISRHSLKIDLDIVGLSELSGIRVFIKSSFALQALRSSLQDFVHPPFRAKLRELLDRPSLTTGLESNKVMADIRGLIAELQEVRPESIGVSCRNKESFTDYLKGIVEDFTSEEWEWWPLKPR